MATATSDNENKKDPNIKMTHYIRKNNINGVILLMKTGVDINHKDIDGWSHLTYAVFKGREDMVKLFIDNGANINNVDEFGYSVLAKSFPYKNDASFCKKRARIGQLLASKGAKYITEGEEYQHVAMKFRYNNW